MTRAAAFCLAQALAVVVMLGAVALASLGLGQPILIPSLAAATFIQVLTPAADGARPWPIVAGQVCGLACGMGAVHLLGAARLPPFGVHHPLDPARAAVVVVAACATLIAQRALRAGNASGAALAATIALGDATATWAGVARGLAGIAMISAIGEGCRLLLVRLRPERG